MLIACNKDGSRGMATSRKGLDRRMQAQTRSSERLRPKHTMCFCAHNNGALISLLNIFEERAVNRGFLGNQMGPPSVHLRQILLRLGQPSRLSTLLILLVVVCLIEPANRSCAGRVNGRTRAHNRVTSAIRSLASQANAITSTTRSTL